MVARIEEVLRSLELERAARIKAQHAPPAHRADDDAIQAGVPLRDRRTSRGPRAPKDASGVRHPP